MLSKEDLEHKVTCVAEISHLYLCIFLLKIPLGFYYMDPDSLYNSLPVPINKTSNVPL